VDIETLFQEIDAWFSCEKYDYEIGRLTESPPKATVPFTAHPNFISVVGDKKAAGPEGEFTVGNLYFEFAPKRFISTQFWG